MSDEWPICDLETLGACPACRSEQRHLMFSGLRDFAFASAPGKWTMWRCDSCDAAYLDPRPTLASIVRAYSRYYTHASMSDVSPKVGALKLLRACVESGLTNDYINRTYGHRLGALPLGAVIVRALPRLRRAADYRIRHLPALPYPGATLLDVGSGSGEFLRLARKLGYRSVGLDPDEQAINSARNTDLDIRKGTLPGSGLPNNSFEHITASHVLEHLHQPKEGLEELWKLLKPGGRLWITQPNLGANGLKEFGIYWRGLEPPRHLTLFDTQGIHRILKRCGFADIELLPPAPVASFYYRQSLCQREGVDPYKTGVPPSWNKAWEKRARDADNAAEGDPRLNESLTVTARRPN
jgi:2-polyprenyl-3-methyl-5-hydroxy-6-metoxy-1,4-benzoquinol methylase